MKGKGKGTNHEIGVADAMGVEETIVGHKRTTSSTENIKRKTTFNINPN